MGGEGEDRSKREGMREGGEDRTNKKKLVE